MRTVWIYVDTNFHVGHRDHLIFETANAADQWIKKNDVEGVAFEYEVMEPAQQPDKFFESPGG